MMPKIILSQEFLRKEQRERKEIKVRSDVLLFMSYVYCPICKGLNISPDFPIVMTLMLIAVILVFTCVYNCMIAYYDVEMDGHNY